MIRRGFDAAPFSTEYKDNETGDYMFVCSSVMYIRYAILTISKLLRGTDVPQC